MECRALGLTIISAGGLKSVSKYDVYAVVRGTGGKKLHITPYLAGSSNLTWDYPMKFTIDEAEGLKDGLHLVIKIMAVNWLLRKTLGKVRVPIKDLMEGITEEGKESVLVSYPVISRKAKTGASLTFSYEFGKKFLHDVEMTSTISGSKVEKSSLEFGELLTAVADVSVQGRGGGGYGGIRGFGGGGYGGIRGFGGGGWVGGGCGGWGGGGGGGCGGGGGGGCGGGGGGGGGGGC